MNSIEISINNIGNNINVFIDIINTKITINNKEKSITKEQIDDLIRIIRAWKSSYQNEKNLIDPESFLIKVNTFEGTDIISGNGEYPENYSSFKKWIGDFYD